MQPTNIEVIHAYRHLYRNLLRAVQYSKPARFTVRNQMRRAFRTPPDAEAAAATHPVAAAPGDPPALPAGFDREAIKRTNWFLEAAARESGLEHKILKNLLRVSWEKDRAVHKYNWAQVAASTRKNAVKADGYRHYEYTVAMLNKTMGLCLRA